MVRAAVYLSVCVFLVAFLLPNAVVFSVEPERLTSDGRVKFSPVFVNTGELVYVDMVSPVLTRIQRFHLADGRIEALFPEAKTQEFEPAFSADGRTCAFVQTRGTLSLALVIHDLEESRSAELPPPGGFAGYRTPTFSPDGTRVVFSMADDGLQDLFSVDTQAANRVKLTKNNGLNYWPCFSPDGNRILFGSTRDGNYEIYSMSADGTDVRRLTDCRFQDIRPRYSPDGKRIAYTSTRDGNYEVYVMDADGTAVVRVTNHPERDDYPTWHPDGNRLVMVSERDGSHDLYVAEIP